MGSCPHVLYKSINRFYNEIIIEPREAARFGNIEFISAHFDLFLSAQSGKETRHTQCAAGEIDKVPYAYCTTTV